MWSSIQFHNKLNHILDISFRFLFNCLDSWRESLRRRHQRKVSLLLISVKVSFERRTFDQDLSQEDQRSLMKTLLKEQLKKQRVQVALQGGLAQLSQLWLKSGLRTPPPLSPRRESRRVITTLGVWWVPDAVAPVERRKGISSLDIKGQLSSQCYWKGN